MLRGGYAIVVPLWAVCRPRAGAYWLRAAFLLRRSVLEPRENGLVIADRELLRRRRERLAVLAHRLHRFANVGDRLVVVVLGLFVRGLKRRRALQLAERRPQDHRV